MNFFWNEAINRLKDIPNIAKSINFLDPNFDFMNVPDVFPKTTKTA